jgi:catechol 2,3-dioxygenase-like lactoylglutathione lyase family enzyme
MAIFGRVVPTIPVTDIDRALRFYRDVLGFDVAFTNGDPVSFAVIKQRSLHQPHALSLPPLPSRRVATGPRPVISQRNGPRLINPHRRLRRSVALPLMHPTRREDRRATQPSFASRDRAASLFRPRQPRLLSRVDRCGPGRSAQA